jgi:5'-methylthioadenosine nucleosidase
MEHDSFRFPRSPNFSYKTAKPNSETSPRVIRDRSLIRYMRRDVLELASHFASLVVILRSLYKQRKQKHRAMSVKTIAVLVAMEAEAAPLVERLGLQKQEKSPFAGPLPAVVFTGLVGDTTVHVCINGPALGFGVDSVGTVPAALTAYQACHVLRPDLLINAGTAGGFAAKGGSVGDVYLATRFCNHDRRIQIPGFDTYGIGAVDAARCPNSLDCPSVDHENLQKNDASVKEMEAAGVAHVARMFGIPLIAVKAITDIVDGDKTTHDEFMENLAAAAKALQDAVPKVIAFVAGKKIEDL